MGTGKVDLQSAESFAEQQLRYLGLVCQGLTAIICLLLFLF